MAIYFEQRRYNKKEFAKMIGVNPDDSKHLNRNITNKLEGMGFQEDQFQVLRSEVVILWVPTTAEEKIPYLCRLLGVDKQTDSFNYAIFVYCLLEEDSFQCMPWAERVNWLRDCYEIEVSEVTLKRWISRLIKDEEVIKDTFTYSWWCSSNIDGVTVRTEVTEEEVERYREWNKEFWNREDVQNLDKKEKGQRWFSECWATFGCKFYRCYGFFFGAWKGDVLQELIDVAKEYIEARY